MQRIATIVAGALVGFLAVSVTPATAMDTQTGAEEKATDISAQSRKRPRATLTIRPYTYPRRNFPTTYPLPYPIEYPGPNAVRECRARYVEDHRPSGTVIVPRMQCWWARG